MTIDVLLRGGTVVDGTGAPGFQADVAITDGKISAIAPQITDDATTVIDASGFIVAPGFIDIHTHHDAQLLWDPELTSSARHGITTVIAGNCGFTVAPVKPGDQDYIIQLLARVEGMPPEALKEGLAWDWESFTEYLKQLDGRLGVNYISQIGHSTVRRYVMGDDAYERAATPEEIETMAGLLRDAVAAGASGFTTSTSPTHNDSFGRAVPSRFAEPEEFYALAEAVKDSPRPMVGISPGTKFSGISPEERELMIGMGQRAGAMVHWNPLMTAPGSDLHKKFMELSVEARAEGVRVVGVYNPGPAGPSRVDLKSGFLFDSLPRWREVLKLPIPERCQALADPTVRQEMKDDLAASNNGRLSEVLRTIWTTLVVTSAPSEANQKYVGRAVADIAAEEGREPIDVMIDISVADELETVFMSERDEDSDAWAIETLLELCHDEDVVFGGSDAGAHLDFMANEPTPSRAFALRVRDQGLLSLEETVHGFTGALADAFGITDRGTLAVGQAADVVVFDLDTIGAESPELVRDLPGDSERLVAAPTGIRATIVNGVIVNDQDTPTGALSGKLL